MSTLAWKINRMKLMGAPEILWRVSQLAQKKASKLGIGLAAKAPPPNLGVTGAPFIAEPAAGVDVAALREAAEQVLAGR